MHTRARKHCYTYTATYFPCVDGFLFVGHGHHSQHEVQQVEGAEEDDNEEEKDVPWPACPDHLHAYTHSTLLVRK